MHELTDGPVSHEITCGLPLRVMDDHIGLGGQTPGLVARRDELVELGGFHRDRLLCQDVFSGGQRFQRPLDMNVVR